MGRHQTSRFGQPVSARATRFQVQAARTPRVLPKPVGMRIRRLLQELAAPRSRCQSWGSRPAAATSARVACWKNSTKLLKLLNVTSAIRVLLRPAGRAP